MGLVMSCCSSVGGFLWDLTAVKILNIVNIFIIIFGLMMIGFASWALAVLGDDAFFSAQIYVLMLIFGLSTLFLAFIACLGEKSPREHPNYIFCYWLLITIMLIGNATGFFAFKVFFDGINSIDDSSDVSSVLETTTAKEANDFLLSVYTSCCTGCDAEIEDLLCEEDIEISDFCANSILDDGTDLDEGDCFFAEICSAEELAEAGVVNGLGLGCYTSASEIPNFSVGDDTCNVFQELELDGDGLVGNAANGVSCGGGEPLEFLENVREYFNDKYYLIAVPWGFLMAFLGLAWVSSLFMILFYTSGRNPYLS